MGVSEQMFCTRNHSLFKKVLQSNNFEVCQAITFKLCVLSAIGGSLYLSPQARELTEVLCTEFIGMTREPEQVRAGKFFNSRQSGGTNLDQVHGLCTCVCCVQRAVERAKMQLKSAMMMNLESRFILCEDIGRSLYHLYSISHILPINIWDGVTYSAIFASSPSVCRQVLGQNVKYTVEELVDKIGINFIVIR